ncbi:MazG nucleotide pyrophosphohydrolase domain-containing protein [Paenibacillus allorhizosphaerae]|uniref:NTP pyrophosphohydrolase MazG-like domain-containing protein n=1 Tax=Paenibacillus allorhizosphaerae TaxID=2849866 RepID=A0ABM8VIL3_9BACL|nr:MazG nucleotide pyrophosphohydrolase domain-containing protein [Paenibacillus allorhizosphaerae]CAG7644324.1 hypothetical protein PAECIP111802_03229 [Paenibacillus allorhizosphaerae]
MENNVTLRGLQQYIKANDYKPELKHVYFQKLIEEVGELSETLRKDSRMQGDAIKGTIEEELYDVLYYVAALANVYDVDLQTCMHLKEALNREKYKHKA